MKHLFVPYELALLAKEKGFYEECYAEYSAITNEPIWVMNGCKLNDTLLNAPLYQQLVDWFVKKDILIQENWDGWYLIQRREIKYLRFDTKIEALTIAFKLI